MKLYQLKAVGTNGFFGDKSGTIYSKRLFPFRSKAMLYEPEFKTKCCTSTGIVDFGYLDPKEPVAFTVLELEIGLWELIRGVIGI